MISIKDLTKISDYLFEIPKSYRNDMKVPARIYTTEKMLEEIIADRSLEQLVNVATLPGIVGYALAMPDIHEGYGFPIGGIAAISHPEGIISPGGIGYDINCGVRLLISHLSFSEIKHYLEQLAQELYRHIPSGVGRGGFLKLSSKDFDIVLNTGAKFMINHCYGEKNDLECIESSGAIPWADAQMVSQHAKKRGFDQLGTMGAGNHFVEIDKVDNIFDQNTASNFGLKKDQIVILIHTGSRGLGHQVATDYIRRMVNSLGKYKITLPDRELACAPLSSKEGKQYFAAMAAAANFAFANRQLITHQVRQVWQKTFGNSQKLAILYDVAHNIAKLEEYEISGKRQKLIIHRKGATRAFPAEHPELPDRYKKTGQPVIIPGSMGTASYVLVGGKNSITQSFGSTCHGAGRRMSRKQAKREIQGSFLKEQLLKQGIYIQTGSLSGLAEEAPLAYKDIDQVVEIVDQAGLAKMVARLKPLAVIKG